MAAKKTVKPVGKSAAEAVKVEAPETASVKAEDKATTPEEPVKAEEKAKPADAKKTVTRRASAKKETEKKTTAEKISAKKETVKKVMAKKAGAKKEEPTEIETGLKTELYVQFADKSLTQAELEKMAKDVWQYDLNQNVNDLTSLELYVKPEDRKAYYVMNKDFTGSFDI